MSAENASAENSIADSPEALRGAIEIVLRIQKERVKAMETVLAQDRCLVCGEGVAHYEGNGDDPQTFLLEVDEAFALQCYIHRDCAARTLPLLAREVQKAMRLLGIEGATLRSCSTCGKEA